MEWQLCYCYYTSTGYCWFQNFHIYNYNIFIFSIISKIKAEEHSEHLANYYSLLAFYYYYYYLYLLFLLLLLLYIAYLLCILHVHILYIITNCKCSHLFFRYASRKYSAFQIIVKASLKNRWVWCFWSLYCSTYKNGLSLSWLE